MTDLLLRRCMTLCFVRICVKQGARGWWWECMLSSESKRQEKERAESGPVMCFNPRTEAGSQADRQSGRLAASRGVQQENETQLNNWNLLKWNLTGNRAENIAHTHKHASEPWLKTVGEWGRPASSRQRWGVCGYCLYSARWLLEHYCASCLWHPAPLSTIHTAWPRNMESAASRLYGGSAFLLFLGFELGLWLEDKNHLKWNWAATWRGECDGRSYGADGEKHLRPPWRRQTALRCYFKSSLLLTPLPPAPAYRWTRLTENFIIWTLTNQRKTLVVY